MLLKTTESCLNNKVIQPVHPKGNQSWIFIGRTDAEAATPILWPPHVKNWLIWKDPDAGKDWGQEEKGLTEDEMVGWHHWLNGHEFEWTPGVGDGQGGLACCDSWGGKELDTTEWLNWLTDWLTEQTIPESQLLTRAKHISWSHLFLWDVNKRFYCTSSSFGDSAEETGSIGDFACLATELKEGWWQTMQ